MKYLATILILFITCLACSRQVAPKPPDQGGLACEPLGLMDLPVGECMGTPAARATMTEQGCVCENREYLPIQTDRGRTCVHLHSILSLLEHIHAIIAELNLPEQQDMPSPTMMRSARSRSAYDLIIQLRALGHDAAELKRLIQNNAPRNVIDRYVRHLQLGIAAHGKQTENTDCAPTPEPTSRDEVLRSHEDLYEDR